MANRFFLTTAESTALDLIEQDQERVAAGFGRLLLLPGGRGCGKSFLLDRASERIEAAGARGTIVVRDGFRGALGLRLDIKQRLRSELGEPILKDLLNLAHVPFGSTLARLLLAIGTARGADPVNRAWSTFRQAGNVSLPDFIALLTERPELRAGRPVTLLLDDCDLAGGARALLPALVRVLLNLAHPDRVPILVVASCAASDPVWQGLETEAAWSDAWRLLPELKPFEPAEVKLYLDHEYGPNDFSPRFLSHLAATTRGVPLLLAETARWLVETGDLFENGGGWTHRPPISRLDSEAAEIAEDAHVSAATAQYLKRRLHDLNVSGKLDSLALAVLELGAIEGQCFTLEAVHRCLALVEKLSAEHESFDAFADWVDGILVAEDAAEDVLSTGRFLTDEVEQGGAGTALYGFVLPALREYLWGRQVRGCAESVPVRDRFRLYASSLQDLYGESPTIAYKLAILWGLSGAFERASKWSERANWGNDRRLLDVALAAHRDAPDGRGARGEVAALRYWRAVLSEDVEPGPEVVAQWQEAVTAAVAAEDEELELSGLHRLAAAHLANAGYAQAMQVIAEAIDRWPALPLIELRGLVHLEMGRFDEARADFTACLQQIEQRLHETGAWVAVSLALGTGGTGRAREVALSEPQRAALLSYATLKQHFGILHQAERDLSAAVEEKRVCLDLKRLLEGPNDRSTLIAMDNLAVTLSSLGRRREARRLKEQALAGFRRLLGEDHTDTLQAKNNLATELGTDGELTQAQALLEEVAAARHRMLGENHPETLIASDNLAGVLTKQGDHEQARRLREDVVQRFAHILGEDHPHTLIAKENLAYTLEQLGDRAGARRLLEEVLHVRLQRFGPMHPSTLHTVGWLVQLEG